MRTFPRSAFTLAELVLVLIILLAIAAMLVPLLGGLEIETSTGNKTEKQVVTETTMRRIRDAIMGSESRPGAWPDLGQRPDKFPTDPNVLLYELSVVQAFDASIQAFNRVTKIGWRGPYLKGTSPLIDAWGNLIVIQIVDVNGNSAVDDLDLRYARLVSLGENQILDTLTTDGYVPGDNNPSNELSFNECGDDVVIFFRVADTREWE